MLPSLPRLVFHLPMMRRLYTWSVRHRIRQVVKNYQRSILPSYQFSSDHSDRFTIPYMDKLDLGSEDVSSEENLLNDENYKTYLRDICSIPDAGHHLFVIQPDIKWGPKKPVWSTPELRLEETCALVKTLPRWRVVVKQVISVKHPSTSHIFGKTRFQELTAFICSSRNISAVLLGVDILSGHQLNTLQKAWGVPVFDRYTIVLQIFKDHAKTKESKLQIALAEIPFLRNRLSQIQEGQHDQQVGGAQFVGGSGESYMEARRQILQEREVKLRRALSKLKEQRSILRKDRVKKQIPIVAVVGYTNAGKTTLIKALTGDDKLEPKDYLFATLDVTAHGGKLPNNMKVIFMDTVGFISDIPTNLIEAFSATLEDAIMADIIIHVRDISHPNNLAQKHNVIQTLSSILPADKIDNIIEVCNKIDLCQGETEIGKDKESIDISAVTGEGLLKVRQRLQEQLVVSTGQLEKKFKIPMGGPHLSWLYKEATVRSVEPDERNVEYLIVDTIISPACYSRFKSQFTKSKTKPN